MRLKYLYIIACVVAALLICTYQVFLYSDNASNFPKHLKHHKFTARENDIAKNVVYFNQTTETNRTSILVTITAEEFRRNSTLKTGNPLIDNYGKNDLTKTGEMGRGVTFVGKEKAETKKKTKLFHVNVIASDLIPLNRLVPDSRPPQCKDRRYEHDLPTTSVIIPFFDEWPSILIRTLYSIINRTPRHLLQEIILIDDASQMPEIKKPLDDYIETHFPKGIIKVIRNEKREGLIKARLQGWRASSGQVVVVFDSHMEVNENWLQPLLTEIKKERKTVAMGVLDYVNADTLEYRYYDDFVVRYGFDWRLVFFEKFFRKDQIGETVADARPGTVMVGAAYAIDSKYFAEIGSYDEGMKVWGGENLEMAWRVWMCGGRLVHLPCSHLGHIARSQPYSFPGGRRNIEVFNYKRAIEVWIEPEMKMFVYDYFPEMKVLDVGDLSNRFALKNRLQCKNFTWFIDNIWPELLIFNRNVIAWGSIFRQTIGIPMGTNSAPLLADLFRYSYEADFQQEQLRRGNKNLASKFKLKNIAEQKCLDNHHYMFEGPGALFYQQCNYQYATQGFSLTNNNLLRTSLHCLVLNGFSEGTRPQLKDCIIGPTHKWKHQRDGYVKHEKSGLCLDVDAGGPIAKICRPDVATQKWQFTKYV